MAPPGDSPDRPDEEERLIRAAQKGDRPAFAALVEGYWDRLYRWLYHLAHDRHTAEDLAQETFLKAFAGLHRFRAGTNFAAWLFRIAHNNFANRRRATARAASRCRRTLRPTPPARPRRPRAARRWRGWPVRWADCRRNSGRRCCSGPSRDCRSARSPRRST